MRSTRDALTTDERASLRAAVKRYTPHTDERPYSAYAPPRSRWERWLGRLMWPHQGRKP